MIGACGIIEIIASILSVPLPEIKDLPVCDTVKHTKKKDEETVKDAKKTKKKSK